MLCGSLRIRRLAVQWSGMWVRVQTLPDESGSSPWQVVIHGDGSDEGAGLVLLDSSVGCFQVEDAAIPQVQLSFQPLTARSLRNQSTCAPIKQEPGNH